MGEFVVRTAEFLPVARAENLQCEGSKVLVVERFDRAWPKFSSR